MLWPVQSEYSAAFAGFKASCVPTPYRSWNIRVSAAVAYSVTKVHNSPTSTSHGVADSTCRISILGMLLTGRGRKLYTRVAWWRCLADTQWGIEGSKPFSLTPSGSQLPVLPNLQQKPRNATIWYVTRARLTVTCQAWSPASP